jgi:inorganic pyrophosphatase
MAARDLTRLDAWDAQSGALNVLIETPKGSRNKFKYDPGAGLFELSKVLPRGAVFPFDFGFVPSTLGDDGDPLDVLVLMEEPVFPGCKVVCRLLGVIEAEQTEGGEAERNDRLIAVAEHSQDHAEVRSLKQLPENLLKEIEHFFASYHAVRGTQFKPLARRGPRKAERLVRAGMERFRRESGGEAKPHGEGRSRSRKG